MKESDMKKIYIKDYNNYTNVFVDLLSDKEEYSYYKKLYNNIYKAYKNKIDNSEIDIKVEMVRLKAKTGKFDNFTKNVNINLILMATTFFLSSFTLAISVGNYSNAFKVSSIITCGAVALIAIFLALYKEMKKNKGFIYDIAIQVLEDIEKEMENKDINVIKHFIGIK